MVIAAFTSTNVYLQGGCNDSAVLVALSYEVDIGDRDICDSGDLVHFQILTCCYKHAAL